MLFTPFGTLFSGTLQTNPNTSAVLITTGDLAAGQYIFQIIITASVSSQFNLELLDAANAVVQTTLIRTLANTTQTVTLAGAISLQTNYELRIRPQANITGTASGAILSCCIIS